MYAIGLAYRGTSNNGAIQKLLHFAVSDVSDNVRRAAVTCLGFVLMNNPAQVEPWTASCLPFSCMQPSSPISPELHDLPDAVRLSR